MRKRILLSVLSVVIFASLFLVMYEKFSASTKAMERTAFNSVFSENISIEYLSDYLKDNPKDHVLFIKDNSQDSTYVLDTILTPLANEQKEQTLPEIVIVDIPEDTQISVTRLKSILNIERYPAFIYLEKDGNFADAKKIEFDASQPLKADDLKTWFFENGLWNGPYGVR